MKRLRRAMYRRRIDEGGWTTVSITYEGGVMTRKTVNGKPRRVLR